MSERTLRLCDKTNQDKPCEEKYILTCVFCNVECCATHTGNRRIFFAVQNKDTSSGFNHVALAEFDVAICIDCGARALPAAYQAAVALGADPDLAAEETFPEIKRA